MNLFELAARKKYRFTSAKGQLTAEQLWDLPLTSKIAGAVTLDEVAKAANRELKALQEESFVVERAGKTGDADFKLQLVVYVIATKKLEAKEAQDAAAKKALKAKLLEQLGKKQDEKYERMDESQLIAMIDSL